MPPTKRTQAASTGTPRTRMDAVDLNQLVAYNFRRARELRGWTQEETAARLEPLLGQRLRQAAISAIEGAFAGERRREFDAQEILVFAAAFDLPLLWFLLPPPDDRRPLATTGDGVDELYALILGREDQQDALRERFRELGHVEPGSDDAALERVYGAPTERALADYQRRRQDLLLALLADRADGLDRAADELGAFFDHLRQVGIRGYVAEHAHDPAYLRPSTTTPTGSKAPRKTQRRVPGKRT